MSDRQFLRTMTVLPVSDIRAAAEWYGQALAMETVYLHEGAQEPAAARLVSVPDGATVKLEAVED